MPIRLPARARHRARRPALLAALLALAGCAATGASGAGRSGDDAIVTLENFSHSPPRVLGLISEEHPAARTDDADLRRSGIKRVPAARMASLLAALESEGFAESSLPIAAAAPADPARVLRRLIVASGGERRAFTLPRAPSEAAAERFNAQQRAVTALFNETVDFRLDGSSRSATYFYEIQQKLYDAEREAQRAHGAGNGGA